MVMPTQTTEKTNQNKLLHGFSCMHVKGVQRYLAQSPATIKEKQKKLHMYVHNPKLGDFLPESGMAIPSWPKKGEVLSLNRKHTLI